MKDRQRASIDLRNALGRSPGRRGSRGVEGNAARGSPPSIDRALGLFAVALLSAAAACGGEASDTPAPAPAPSSSAPPEILSTGCASLRDDQCPRVADEPLRIWIAGAAPGSVRATIDGRPAEVEAVAIDGGARVVIAPGIVGRLEIGADGEGWRWSLSLAPPPTIDPRIEAIRAAGDREGADGAALRAQLDALLPALAPADRAEALALRGDLWFFDGDPEAALAAYEQSFDPLVDAGAHRRASEVAVTSSFAALILRSDRAAAAAWLRRHAQLFDRYPESRLRHAYYAAVLADRGGDLRAALAGLEAHERAARALGRDDHRFAALTQKGVLLARLGDRVAADAAFAEAFALEAAAPAQARARALVNAAWIDLEALALGLPAADPAPRLREALALAEARDDRVGAEEARLNLAYCSLLQGQVASARSELAALDPQRAETRRWRDYLAARVELAAGRPDAALAGFTALDGTAAGVADRTLRSAALVGAGEALEALGRADAALLSYRAAEAQDAAMLADIAIDGGRERFAGARDRASRRLVDLLLRRERPAEALCAVRSARARAHRGLAWEARRGALDPEARRAQEAALAEYRRTRASIDAAFEASWSLARRRGEAERARLRGEAERARALLDGALALDPSADASPCDAQPRPAAGALRLFYAPLDEGYVAFSLAADGALAHARVGPLSEAADARADALLGPFAAAIDGVDRLELVAGGALAAEPFHALPLAGAPLAMTRAVAYSMDLSEGTGLKGQGRRAMVLAPPSNLAAAPAEIAAVESALAAAGWALTRRRGDEDDLGEAIVASDLLFYAGHADAGGRGGWASALVLGGDRRLVVGDLLALPGRAPARVILSGCETGLVDPRALAGGMSLASALLLAGAELVIATDAPVDDRLAAALTPPLIAAIAAGEDGVVALARAQRAIAGEHPEWARFRAIVP